MRARGAQVTDIAIIVVAADDGVMPQTREAISHVKDAKVPFMIAVNKMDKPSANPDFVKTQLSEMGISPIEWGGEYEFVHISAKTGEGLETLLDTILIQAEILELKANPKKNAKAIVVEASLEKGRGAVATVLVQDGTLKVGDNVVVGQNYGKIRAIIDDMGANIKALKPSEPGRILGLDGVPGAGDVLVAVENERVAREYAENIKEHQRQRELSKTTKATFDDLHHLIKEGKLKRLNVILKADVHFVVPCFRIIQSSHSSYLHGLKLTAVDIAFYLQYPLYKLCIRSQHSHTPTRHIVRFAHRIEFDTNIFCSFDL
jgi:translation initiation factor IF-2